MGYLDRPRAGRACPACSGASPRYFVGACSSCGSRPLARYHVGDVFCSGVDVESFTESVRAPIFPEQWNRWQLLWSLKGNPSKRDLQDRTVDVIVRWFNRWQTKAGTEDFGDVDHVNVHVGEIGKLTPPPSGGGRSTDWAQAKTVITVQEASATWTAATGVGVSVDPTDGVQVVEVEFVLRASKRDMPWPVWKPNPLTPVSPFLGFNEWCPDRARCIVLAVRQPSDRDVPKESRVTDLPKSPTFWGAVGGTAILGAVVVGVALAVVLKR